MSKELETCPKCGGHADNGFSRKIPPSPYYCRACMAEDRIEELEADRDKLTERVAELEMLYNYVFDRSKEIADERDELVAALNRLYVACPTTLECRHFHHSKRERHSYIEPCGPADEYLEALNQARSAIAKGEK